MTFSTKNIVKTLLDWTRKFFFACVFATLVSFWSAKWEMAQEESQLKSCEGRLPAGKMVKTRKVKRREVHAR